MEEVKLSLFSNRGVTLFKSLSRAYQRNLIAPDGTIYPTRPFHNKKNTSKRKGVHSRTINELKKRYYESIKRRK